MATILTVHGTNASGPPEGQHWWQRSSPCEADMRRLVAGADGRLDIVPVIWDGANSEMSRQAAGTALLKKAAALEEAKEPYCVVGHSHGGSIIAAALIESVHRGRPLASLSRWITVGTPFIASRRKWLLFSRLGFIGKASYLAMLTYVIGLVYYFSKFGDPSENLWAKWIGVVVLAILMGLPVILFYFLLRWQSGNKLPWHAPKTQSAAAAQYGAKWQSLWHEDDEAIRGLASLKTMNFPFFARDFAVPAVSFLAILAVPLLAAWFLLTYQPKVPDIGLPTGDNQPTQQSTPTPQGSAQKQGPGTPAGKSATAPAAKDQPKAAPGATAPSANQPPSEDEETKHSGWMLAIFAALGLLGPPFMVAGFAIGILYFFRMLARPTSGWLSRHLNTLTSSEMRRAALGNDAEGQIATDAKSHPMWLERGFPPLPKPLTDEISRYSDEAAGKAIAKVRAALSNPAFTDLSKKQSDLFLEYLTWDELIHTAYFKVPRFQKLLAYAIAVSPGFQPTAEFQSDPEFALVKAWYEELQRGYAGAVQSTTPERTAMAAREA